MFLVYPAIFYAAEEGGYIVEFPDLDGLVTQGDGEAEAFEMAEDALGTWLYEAYIAGEGYPKASAIKDIKPEALEATVQAGTFVTLVGLDIDAYVRSMDHKTVQRTVSLPSYLNEMARNRNINCSQLLQEALKKELHCV